MVLERNKSKTNQELTENILWHSCWFFWKKLKKESNNFKKYLLNLQALKRRGLDQEDLLLLRIFLILIIQSCLAYQRLKGSKSLSLLENSLVESSRTDFNQKLLLIKSPNIVLLPNHKDQSKAHQKTYHKPKDKNNNGFRKDRNFFKQSEIWLLIKIKFSDKHKYLRKNMK